MADSAAVVVAILVTAWTLDVVLLQGALSVFWGAVPLLIALSIFLLIERKDWIFNNSVASTIGVLSYSLYLWQQKFTLQWPGSVVTSLLMLTGCAVASYLLIEKPMLKFGASIQSRKLVRQQLEKATPSPVFQTETLTRND